MQNLIYLAILAAGVIPVVFAKQFGWEANPAFLLKFCGLGIVGAGLLLYNFDYKNLFGYGPQADRRFLTHEEADYGNNVSNGFIYAFICGGYLALICYLIINFKITSNIINNISVINKLKNTDNIFYYKLSSIYLLFFLIRQLFENSFSVFSIDFLIVVICSLIIDKNNQYIKKLIFLN